MRKKILLVEDNADSRHILAKMLELEGYSVVLAEDGLRGIELARLEQPDAIITDINMPRLDGIRMTETIRAKLNLTQVPIIALTAFGSDMMAGAIEAGADAALAKPLDYELLIRRIEQLFKRPCAKNVPLPKSSGMSASG
jgi:CheY-like chemotaxis protein